MDPVRRFEREPGLLGVEGPSRRAAAPFPARQSAGRAAKVAVGVSLEMAPMRPPADENPLSPQDRSRELARLLATGLLRLRDRAALPEPPADDDPPEHPLENYPEIPPELP
jgi:hypothetical protein